MGRVSHHHLFQVVQKVIKFEGEKSAIARIYQGDKKKYISIVLYLLGIGLSFIFVKWLFFFILLLPCCGLYPINVLKRLVEFMNLNFPHTLRPTLSSMANSPN